MLKNIILKKTNEYSWQDAFILLVSQFRLDSEQVRCGSIPEPTLQKLCNYFVGNGLQIGGFVGLTHAYIANHLKNNNQGFICTIDCNVTHRDIKDPIKKLNFLVRHYGFDENSMIILDYAERTMKNYIKLGSKFDFVLLDGNHNYHNVLREIKLANNLLKKNGSIILDDIDHWTGPKKLFENFPLQNYKKIEIDSRAGLFKKVYDA